MGNARVASPYFMETGSGNIFVTGASGQFQSFMTYSFSDLEPGSEVTFSCDVYNLWSTDVVEEYLMLINDNVFNQNDLIK